MIHFLFSKMTSLNRDVSGVLSFGTDGEDELIKAMKRNFTHALSLRCFRHFRDNCKGVLKKSNVPEAVQQEFLSDIFGSKLGGIFEKGEHTFQSFHVRVQIYALLRACILGFNYCMMNHYICFVGLCGNWRILIGDSTRA